MLVWEVIKKKEFVRLKMVLKKEDLFSFYTFYGGGGKTLEPSALHDWLQNRSPALVIEH